MNIAPELAAHPGVRYLQELGNDPALARILGGYAGAFPLCLFSEPREWRRRRHLGAARFLRPAQRPRFYFPALTARPWHERTAAAAALERAFEVIRAEFRSLDTQLRSHPEPHLVGAGAWNQFTLVRGGKAREENVARCPRTAQVIAGLPACSGDGATVYFSVVEPGTEIKPHCGFSNARIRHHLGLEVPEGVALTVAGETRAWKEGECLVFDDSFEHSVRHAGRVRRAVLLVDCWHPDLTSAEIDCVARLQTLFGLARR
jgi:hypothetical protein